MLRPAAGILAAAFIIIKRLFFCLLFLSTLPVLYGENTISLIPRRYDNLYDVRNKNVLLEIECHSGTPPVLEFVLKDSMGIVEKLFFDFENDGEIDIEIDEMTGETNVDKIVFRGTPYRKKGTYTLAVYLKTEYGTFLREYAVSFTDFVWGRDNFNFANDGKFENAIDFVSKIVIDWAEDRFGQLAEDQKVLLLYVMYSIYKGSIGRCYGFSGGEVYYFRHPDRILYPYLNTYTMDEKDERIIKEMDYVQNDIVFSNFVSGRITLSGKQDNEHLITELNKIKDSVRTGNQIILGYLSKKMHHSMVVYGYFENLYRNSTTLLVANNWERKQNGNSFSDDAENLVINFKEQSHTIQWYDITKKKYRYPEMIFSIEREENYSLDRGDFVDLIRNTGDTILRNGRIIIMVEKTEEAYVVDADGKRKGYKKPRRLNEIDEVLFKKIDYNYVFEIPKEGEYTLILKRRRYNKNKKMYEKVNLFGILPAQSGIETVVYKGLAIDEKEEKVFQINKDGIQME